eukprot:1141017-Pelagomonas_calceolata.AAC.1
MVCFQDGWGLEVAWAGRPPVTCTCGALERWRPQKVCSRDGWGHEVAWAGKPPATCSSGACCGEGQHGIRVGRHDARLHPPRGRKLGCVHAGVVLTHPLMHACTP